MKDNPVRLRLRTRGTVFRYLTKRSVPVLAKINKTIERYEQRIKLLQEGIRNLQLKINDLERVKRGYKIIANIDPDDKHSEVNLSELNKS